MIIRLDERTKALGKNIQQEVEWTSFDEDDLMQLRRNSSGGQFEEGIEPRTETRLKKVEVKISLSTLFRPWTADGDSGSEAKNLMPWRGT